MSERKEIGRLAVSDVTGAAAPVPIRSDFGSEQRARVADELSTRLRRNGVRLLGKESLEELAELLEAVERFEAAVEERGGDLMVDEPINCIEPIAPDVADYLLPLRGGRESVARFVERIDDAVISLRRSRR